MTEIGPIEKLGTVWRFEFFDLDQNRIPEIERKIVEVMDAFEGNYSRFKEDSLLSRLNNNRRLDLRGKREIREMLQIALEAYRTTNGVFNIAIGGYLERIGYDAQYSFQSQETVEIPRLDQVLQLTEQSTMLDDGVKIDFGGFGKGYLIDVLANLFRQEWGLEFFLINGGGDICVSSDHGKPVEIGLENPVSKKIIGTVPLLNQGFASSSPHLRSWTDQDGNRRDHLVGEGEKKTVYVVAPNATWADIWATTLSIDQAVPLPKDVQVKIV